MVVFAVLVGLVLGVAFFFISKWIAFRLLMISAADQNTPEGTLKYSAAANDSWRTVAQIIGGAAVGLTFVYTMLQDRSTAMRAREQEANRLYIEASKLLEGEKPAARAAAVYALNLVTEDRTAYHMPMRDLLVAVIAEQKPTRSVEKNIDDLQVRAPDIPVQVQAAVNVLGH